MTIDTAESRAAYELLALRTEYAVRIGNEPPQIVPDKTIQAQTVADLLDQGQRAEPVYRTVTVWQTDETAATQINREVARQRLLSIAQNAWEQHGDHVDHMLEHAPRPLALAALGTLLAGPVAETAQHSTLGDDARLDKLVDLLGELTHQEAVEDDEVAPGPGEDKQSLLDDAERRVTEAADALYGGAA